MPAKFWECSWAHFAALLLACSVPFSSDWELPGGGRPAGAVVKDSLSKGSGPPALSPDSSHKCACRLGHCSNPSAACAGSLLHTGFYSPVY